MPDLHAMINQHQELRWTEEELVAWIEKLPEEKQRVFLGALKDARRRGLNVHRMGCKFREAAERIDRQNQMPWYQLVSDAMIGWTLGGIISGTKKLC